MGKPTSNKNSRSASDAFDYLLDLVNLKKGVDYRATVAEINEKKSMDGANAWMLICSIMIASIGLNTNSQAVIIGAMLISPLMSPILAIGLAVAINDKKALKESLSHFGVSIIIAITTSTLFFLISPLKEFTEQIAARTAPTIFDVAIGVFGGIAGIISIARKDISTTIPGVAIATALMPPLCVTGYGIAIGNAQIAAFSFYLFFINAFFVAFSTYVIIRYLGFPLIEYASKEERSKNRKYIILFSFLMVIPSLLLFWKVWKTTSTTANVRSFVQEYVGGNQIYLDEYEIVPTLNGNSVLYMRVWGDAIQNENLSSFDEGLKKYGIRNTSVKILPSSEIKLSKIKELETELIQLSNSTEDLDQLRAKMDLQNEILLSLRNQDSVSVLKDFSMVTEELKILIPEAEAIQIGQSAYMDIDSTQKEMLLVVTQWASKKETNRAEDQRIIEFLKLRLKADSISYLSRFN